MFSKAHTASKSPLFWRSKSRVGREINVAGPDKKIAVSMEMGRRKEEEEDDDDEWDIDEK